jgi:hypothetical protein
MPRHAGTPNSPACPSTLFPNVGSKAPSGLDFSVWTRVAGLLMGLLFFFFFFFFFAVLGFELRTYTLSHSTSPFFVKGRFDIGCHKLFVQAGFEP